MLLTPLPKNHGNVVLLGRFDGAFYLLQGAFDDPFLSHGQLGLRKRQMYPPTATPNKEK